MPRPIRVLVVEDNRASCALLRAFFEMAEGLELCGEAHNGFEGLELLRGEWPDLVLLDLVMPGMDGMEFLEVLQKETLVKRPKVLVLSGIGSDEYVQRAIKLGASYYLMKPMRLGELGARINELFPAEEEESDHPATWLLLRMGADKNCLGFSFACRGEELLREAEGEPQLKEIYLRIAEEFDTSYACVEKNLRTTIRQVHAAATATYRESLGFGGGAKQPDNGSFLRALAKELGKAQS